MNRILRSISTRQNIISFLSHRSITTLISNKPTLQSKQSINSTVPFYNSFTSSTKPTQTPITVIYIEPDGEEYEVTAELGDNFLDVAHDNDIELEGACGGELACSTCHLIFEQEYFDKLDEMDEEEEDMLDLAFNLEDTSRLGCQVCATPELNGMRLKIPDESADLR